MGPSDCKCIGLLITSIIFFIVIMVIFILIMILAMLFNAPAAGLYGITALTGLFFFYRVARLDQEGRALARQRKTN